jgi:predicted anti-sigma-YlaC factor YlaD
MSSCDRYKGLLTGLLDSELTSEETALVNDHLIRCASCRADYDSLRRTEDKLSTVSFVEVGDEAARAFWRLPYSRALRITGFLLIVGGYVALALQALFTLLSKGLDAALEALPMAAIVIGLLILFGVVLIDRIISWQTDPYKEIER